MMQFLIAAPSSGSGKTTVTCAVLAALKRRGAAPCAFKTGPDYIDPMFHRSALGVESHNLDLFLSTKDTVQALYARYAAGHGAAVCEGAMGFYDGQGLTTRASAWELADTLGLPVLLVVQPKGASVTLAAQIQGLVHFRKNSHLAGILLNNCSEKLYNMLKTLLEAETGLPVLGYLPHLPEAVVESRHLGLKTADEIVGLQEKIALLADSLVLDWDKLAELTEKPEPESERLPPWGKASLLPRIAVAKDEAFCFTYAETLDALRDAGAKLVFFSPVHDAALPEGIGGLYLPGGEHAAQQAAALQQGGVRAHTRRGNRRANARRAAAHHKHIILQRGNSSGNHSCFRLLFDFYTGLKTKNKKKSGFYVKRFRAQPYRKAPRWSAWAAWDRPGGRASSPPPARPWRPDGC